MPSAPSGKLLSDRLENARPGERVDKWVYSAFPKDHWVARKPGDLTHAEHPGTAIQIGEDLYEVFLVEETAQPGYLLRYGLKKWEPHHALRSVVPYTPETQARSAADYLDETHKQTLRSGILWLLPLAGMAPDPLQREWEMKTALNMTIISAVSALTQLFLFMTLVETFGLPARAIQVTYVIYYVGIDAFARLLRIILSGKPHGMYILTLPYLLWEAVAHPEKRARKKALAMKFALEGDEVIRRPATGHLVIRSMLFDDLLTGPHPVRFEGGVYKPLNWHLEGKGLDRRWVYEFEKMDADPKGKYREYTQPRLPQRQKAVEDLTRTLDRTHMFGLLWGTYPANEQVRLEAKYQFPAVQMTAATAGLLLAAGALQTWAIKLIGAPAYTYLGSLYFVLESLYRLYVSKVQGQPAGSLAGWVLGWFLRPPR